MYFCVSFLGGSSLKNIYRLLNAFTLSADLLYVFNNSVKGRDWAASLVCSPLFRNTGQTWYTCKVNTNI